MADNHRRYRLATLLCPVFLFCRKAEKELTDILDRLQQAKINTVLIQTRVRGTMIYPSAYEPWDGCLSGFPGRSPGYDALQFAIDECHKRGMELHAWVVTIPVGNGTHSAAKPSDRRFRNSSRRLEPTDTWIRKTVGLVII